MILMISRWERYLYSAFFKNLNLKIAGLDFVMF